MIALLNEVDKKVLLCRYVETFTRNNEIFSFSSIKLGNIWAALHYTLPEYFLLNELKFSVRYILIRNLLVYYASIQTAAGFEDVHTCTYCSYMSCMFWLPVNRLVVLLLECFGCA